MADAVRSRISIDTDERRVAVASSRASPPYDDGSKPTAAVAGAVAIFWGAVAGFIYTPAITIALFVGAVSRPASPVST